MAIRISGLNSGLDTDSIVKELVSAYSLKTEKYEKAKTKLEWKQDAWKTLNNKIYSLYKNISNLRYSNAFNLQKTTVSDSTKAIVTASGSAVSGTQTLSIKSTAQTAYLTGGKLKLSETALENSTDKKVTANSTLADLGYQGEEVTLSIGNDKEIKVNKDTKISELITKLKDDKEGLGLNASFDANNQRIFISSKTSGTTGDFTLTQKDAQDGKSELLRLLGLNTTLTESETTAKSFFVEENENGTALENTIAKITNHVTDYSNAQNAINTAQDNIRAYEKQYEAKSVYEELKIYTDKYSIDIEALSSAYEYKNTNITLNDPKGIDGYLKSIGITDANTVNEIKGKLNSLAEYKESAGYEDGTKLSEVLNDLNDGTLEDIENAIQNELEIIQNAEAVMTNTQDTMQALNGKTVEELANEAIAANDVVNNMACKIAGSDAQIVLNGVLYESSSNNFSINGLNITAQGVTTDELTITTSVDAQGIYDKIKDFLTEYNTVINEMTKLYNAESSKGYEPLTNEEKDAMSETEVEKWEAKIKDSLLRRDDTLNSIMSTMVNTMGQTIEVNGKKICLSNYGIQTLGFLNAADNEHYAYHIDGDEDDANTSIKKDKLMSAIQENADEVCEFMKGFMENLYKSLDKRMKSTTLSSAYKVYNDKEMDNQLRDYKKLISEWEEKVAEKEKYYYDKFSAMETALSQTQSQTNALSGLLGM